MEKNWKGNGKVMEKKWKRNGKGNKANGMGLEEKRRKRKGKRTGIKQIKKRKWNEIERKIEKGMKNKWKENPGHWKGMKNEWTGNGKGTEKGI